MSLPLGQYATLLVTYLRPQWVRVVVLTVVLLGDMGLQLVNPQILRFFIDTARAGGASSTLASAAVLFLIVVLGTQLVSSLATYLSQDVGWTAHLALGRQTRSLLVIVARLKAASPCFIVAASPRSAAASASWSGNVRT